MILKILCNQTIVQFVNPISIDYNANTVCWPNTAISTLFIIYKLLYIHLTKRKLFKIYTVFL